MKSPSIRRLRSASLALLTAVLAATSLTATAPAASAATSAGTLKAASSGKCLDVSGASRSNGADVQLWTCNGGDNQTWTVTSAGELRVYGTAMCLDVAEHDTSSPARLQTYGCTGNSNQRWTISGDTVKGVESGLCLDVSGNRTDNGAPVQLYTCNSTKAQSWTVPGTTSTSPSTGTTWTQDWNDNFNSLDDAKWGRYGYGNQPVGNGAMGVYKPENVYAHDGVMALRTQYANGAWSSAGVSGNPGFSAVGGKWEVRAKMPTAKGIGYVFLLMPTDGSWPPELNIAEGRVNGRVESFYHWGTASQNYQAYSINSDVNTHEWHTYGAIMDIANNQVIFTIDGDNVTGTLKNVPVTSKRMWMGMQTGAMDPNGSAKDYETIDGGVPNSKTPASSEIQIDWVAHYHS